MIVDLRLALPAAGAWAATVVLVGLPDASLPIAVALWASGAVAAVLALRERWLATVALVLVAAAACATAVAVQAPQRHPGWVTQAVEGGRTAEAVLVAVEGVAPGIRSWNGRLIELDGRSLDTPVVVFGGVPGERLDPGTAVAARVTLEPTDAGDAAAFVVFPDDEVIAVRAPPAALAWANGLRAGFRAAAADLPGAGGQLLSGLAIGDTSLVTEELDAAMKTASLSHLTAVSGANCAIVVGLMMIVGGALGIPRLVRVLLSLLVLAAFVVLVTPEPSVQRAAVMAGVVLALVAFGRPVRGLPVLSLAVVGLLLADPWLARSYGFALSVLATAGLLTLAGPLARRLERWLPRWLALVIAVPTAAQLACQPVLVLLDASLPTYGVVANVLAAPAAPAATVVGLAACLLLPLAPALGAALCAIAWAPAAWIGAVATVSASLPAARLPWPGEAVGVALLALVTAAAIVAILARGRARRWASWVLALAAIVYVATTGGSRLLDVVSRPPDWQYAACDVGQGDAMLVRSADHVALIDTGPEPAPLSACLADLGVGRIDLLVLTHYDLDHVGGASAVLGRVDRAIVGPTGSPEDAALGAQLAESGASVEQGVRGQQGLLGDLRWSILWPPARGAPEPGNAASVTLRFDGVGECPRGCLSGLFLGDLGEDAQRSLVGLGGIGPVDVVKVAHHGSADQDADLYRRAAAAAGLIGVGADNGYGHPTSDALDMLAAAGTTALRTDTQGLILLAPGQEPGSVRVWAQRGP